MAKLITSRVICSFVVRLVAFSATLIATIVMASSHQRGTYFGLPFEVRYNNTPAFKYFVIANAVATIYGFLILFLPSGSPVWRLVVALDAVITSLLASSISAALAIGDVGKKGNSSAGWLPICGQVPKYCHQVTGALVAGFIAFLLYILLLLHSIHTLLNPLLLPNP